MENLETSSGVEQCPSEDRFLKLDTKLTECCFTSIPRNRRRAIWELTHYCPQNCPYCFTSSSVELDKNKDFLKKNRTKVIGLFQSLDVEDVLLTGGEPLSIEDGLIDIARILNKRDISYSVSTTGRPRKYLEKICDLSPRRINLSFDPKKNDGSAFWKSDREVLEGVLSVITKKEVPVKLTAVITKENSENVTEYVEVLTDLISQYEIVEKIALTHEYPIGRGILEEGLVYDELQRIFSDLEPLLPGLPSDISLVNWPSFNNKLQFCPAGKSIFSIMPNGDITPCSLLYYLSRAFKIGNFTRNNKSEIEQLLKIFHEGVTRHLKELTTWNVTCKKCGNRKICGGGCFAIMPVLMFDHRERIICKLQPELITDEQKLVFANIERPLREDYEIPPSSGKDERIDSELERRMERFVKKATSKADLAHSLDHISAVVKLGKYIAAGEIANEKVVVIACYFHDAAPRNASMHHFHTFGAAKIAEDFLRDSAEMSDEEIGHVKECIISSSYGSYLLGIEPRSIEARIVRDADLLDAIGAKGVARVFAFAAAHGIKEFGSVEYSPPHFPMIFEMNLTGPDRSPIHHFYTKLLKLKDLMLTDAGKRLAQTRHEFMVDFLKRYSAEENLENNNLLQSSIDKGW